MSAKNLKSAVLAAAAEASQSKFAFLDDLFHQLPQLETATTEQLLRAGIQ